MNDPRISRLEERLAGLEQRLAVLESRFAPESDTPIQPSDLSPGPVPATTDPAAAGAAGATLSFFTMLGRLLIILGGAFMLRAATHAGVWPAPVGVTLGLAYGVAQIVLARRAARGGAAASANWFGLGGAMIVLPLIVESTLDFRILDPGVASVLLPVLGSLGVAVAVRARLRPMAWIFLSGTGSVGLLLAIRTGFGAGFPLGVIFVGLVGLWLGYLRGWTVLAIVGSLVPVAMVMGASLLVALEYEGSVTAQLTPAVGLVLQLTLIAGFLGSFLARALRWSAPVGYLEVGQSILALTIGFVGALVSMHKDPSLRAPLGIFMLVTGLGCYLISFSRIDRRKGERGNFAFFSSVALVGMLAGNALILSGRVELALFIVAAMALAFFGARRRRATLSLHAAIYVVGAGFSSGLVPTALDALFGAVAAVPAHPLPMFLVLAVAAICVGAPVVDRGRTWGRLSRLPKAVYLFFLLVAVDGLVTVYLVRTIGREGDAGLVAAVRTGLLALSAIALGLISRRPRLREGAMLVPLVLVLGAAALLLGDLRNGRPATQFASLALYGAALIVAPRLARRARTEAPPGLEAGPGGSGAVESADSGRAP